MRNCDLMEDLPDYRSEKMDSAEGRGIAADRFYAWTGTLPPDVVEAFGYNHIHSVPSEIADWANATVKEFSELVGFWIAWHSCGGFERLEQAGWNRATIFRKVRRFRSVFEAHPDEYEFPWITLDLEKRWWENLREDAAFNESPKAPS